MSDRTFYILNRFLELRWIFLFEDQIQNLIKFFHKKLILRCFMIPEIRFKIYILCSFMRNGYPQVRRPIIIL